MAITLYEYVCFKSGKNPETDSVSAGDADRAGVPFFSGCTCTESLGLFNAHPTKTGYIQCSACVQNSGEGFATVQEFDAWQEEQNKEVLCGCGEVATDTVLVEGKECHLCDVCISRSEHGEGGPPYDAATATGMYDHDDGN